jgi:2-keto-4-pentenoate hydratase/2-oxohepta-3-ene-1,7-dioic acid hydratase in catechol pathway
LKDIKSISEISFGLHVNGKLRQEGRASEMMFSFNEIICWCSRFFTLQPGDLIFTGTPSGVGPVQAGDHLEGFLEGQKMLDFYII